jgi:hypothetical protein
MPGLRQIQNMLERELGTGMPYHNYFWRGKTRDELVATQVFGLTLVVPGRAEESNLLRAMKGLLANDGSANPVGLSLLRALFRQARFSERDVALLEAWISESCPEVPYKVKPTTAAVRAPVPAASDDTHVQYWRAIDDFFLPGLASEETVPHVNRMHFAALQRWLPSVLGGQSQVWTDYLGQPDVAESFKYIRHHQRRLIEEFYGSSQPDLFDSHWKFGGNLLPVDPMSHALPRHTMNSVSDWFFWSPYLDAALRAPDVEAVDVDLGARVADRNRRGRTITDGR